MRVMLVATPWCEASAPSVQVAVLKSYLAQNGIAVAAKHYHAVLAGVLGLPLYDRIVGAGAGEALAARHVYSEGLGKPGHDVDRFLVDAGLSDDDVRIADRGIRSLRDRFLSEVSSWEPDLVGFTLTYRQLSTSLCLAAELKKVHPSTTIVFGGIGCSADMGRSLLEAFEPIDFVVTGEGEQALLDIVRSIKEGRPVRVGGVFSRSEGCVALSGPVEQLPDLDELPYPDYTEYFEQARAGGLRLVHEIPIEGARGCWWNRCKFCSFNVQFAGYRHKSAERVMRELTDQARVYRNLRFTFTDNIPPKQAFADTLRHIGQSELDFSIFRFSPKNGQTTAELFTLMRAAGVRVVQPGIESFSPSLIRKMNKGVRCIDNLHILKRCREAGIEAGYNLITGFPGETLAEVQETLAVCRKVEHLDPPTTFSPFALVYRSPVFCDPESFGIRSVRPHHGYCYQFPAEVLDRLTLFEYEYDGGTDEAATRAWTEVESQVSAWRRSSAELTYQDGADFLVIDDTREGRKRRIVLEEPQRRVFLACDEVSTREDLARRAADVPADGIDRALNAIEKLDLVFREGDLYLALPVHDVLD